jgi:hypothetical protein
VPTFFNFSAAVQPASPRRRDRLRDPRMGRGDGQWSLRYRRGDSVLLVRRRGGLDDFTSTDLAAERRVWAIKARRHRHRRP